MTWKETDDREETSEVADVLPPFSVLSGCHSLCFHPSSEWRIKSIRDNMGLELEISSATKYRASLVTRG